MSKLFKLKEWVAIPVAARHLSRILNDEVSEADIIQMAIDGHIRLSVIFPNRAYAKLGQIVPYRNVPLKELPNLDGKGTTTYVDGYLIEDVAPNQITQETSFVCFEDHVQSIDGIWDLAMKGNERIGVEFELHQMIGGPEVTMINVDGTFLNRPDGTWAALQDQFDDEVVTDKDGRKKKIRGDYYPAGGLGDDCIKVIRTSEILTLQNKIEGRLDDKPLSTRERSTLLNIIGVLLEKYSKKDEPLIDEIQQAYPTVPGLKRRTLQEKFAEARRSLKSN